MKLLGVVTSRRPQKVGTQLVPGLSPGLITNFLVLEALFHQYFIAGHRHKKTSIHLMLIKQQEHESLVDYIKRLNEGSLKISDLEDGLAFTTLIRGNLMAKKVQMVLG